MIATVDSYIETQLKKVKIGSKPIQVYSYLPDRDQGLTKLPCFAFYRHEENIQTEDVRSEAFPVFNTVGDEIIIDVPLDMGGDRTEVGTPGYTEKRYPTPVTLLYEIQILATLKNDFDRMFPMLLEALPPGHSPRFSSNCTPTFVYGKPITIDDLTKPIFGRIYLINVIDVWVDRLLSTSRTSIQSIDFDGSTTT